MKKLFFILFAACFLFSCAKDTSVFSEPASAKGGNGNGNNGNGNGNGNQNAVVATFGPGEAQLGIPNPYIRLPWTINDTRPIASITISKKIGNGQYIDVHVQTPGIANSHWDDPVFSAPSCYKLRGVFTDGTLIVGNPDPLIGIEDPF